MNSLRAQKPELPVWLENTPIDTTTENQDRIMLQL